MNARTRSLAEYEEILNALGDCPELSAEEEFNYVQRMHQGDEQARCILLRSQDRMILDKSRRMCDRFLNGHHLSDIFAEVRTKVYIKITAFEPFDKKTGARRRLSTFVGTIAKNALIDRGKHYRRYQKRYKSLVDVVEDVARNHDPTNELAISEEDLFPTSDDQFFLIFLNTFAEQMFSTEEKIALCAILNKERLQELVEGHGKSKSYWYEKISFVKKRIKIFLENLNDPNEYFKP